MLMLVSPYHTLEFGCTETSKIMNTKPWYTSKIIWGSFIVGVIGIYNAMIAQGIHLPQIPEIFYALLGAFGIAARATSNTTLTK